MQNQLIEPVEVDKIIGEVSLNLKIEEVDLVHSLGRTLAEDIFADRDFPPFHRVAMDGVGIHSSQLGKTDKIFEVEGVQAAGSPQLTLENRENCLEVMTGSVLPLNAEVVIPYEWTEKVEGGVKILDFKNAQMMSNVHQKGSDKAEGEVLIKAGKEISSSEIGILATVGKSKVKVFVRPKIAVIATGDELVGVDDTPNDYQIRMSNCYSLKATLSENGFDSEIFHLTDDKEELLIKIKNIKEQFDVLVFSGGVSKGKFDFLPEVFESLGIKKQFHGVKQRPGKPFWFGKSDKQVVFALPGNPVSTYLCSNRYMIPWLNSQLKKEKYLPSKAILDKDFKFNKPLTFFLQVETFYKEDGLLYANPISGGGSGDLAKLSAANAFIELNAEVNEYKKGQQYTVWFYKK
ncbi:molybdopterin molybdotransferase MoeA [Flammeovirga yaeyamensis]|uniref:Molybdopterin molybdenumtransferase n=1 Tax=Flammeovirga yaeyamensis TaxID=367791 RepID=A0AAX1N7C0_9BACT|nr:molybdopterin molybdotransferase MoeA [Flammeovirga yaeyamensis]MBB3698055.1 molybdopterin molybdotransferase [Flammeovirga yaeyamensis]NMF35593.1 molybdopterin molybdotransferase MoeA [Flammeovirga yaeyamensis]QWG03449.1 molybdopterin molybdotransferase MoeA [Flammeovirga yaeyamensis]